MAAPGDYYLFDSTGCVLVRPSSRSFSYHPFFNSQELWADRHVDETRNPARPHNSAMPTFWFGVTEALAQNWKTDGRLPSGHSWLSAFGSELPAEIYVKTSDLSIIPRRSVDLSRFVLPDGFTETKLFLLTPKLDSTSSPDAGEHWRRPPAELDAGNRTVRETGPRPSTLATRVDTVPRGSTASNADIQPGILIPRILLDQRTTIDANGRLRSPVVSTQAEGSAELDRTRAQTDKRPTPRESLDTTARITVDFQQTDIREVLRLFAAFSGRTIIVRDGVTGSVTASIKDQPWKAALRSILQSQGLSAVEDSTGVITVARNSDVGGETRIGSAFGGLGYVLKAQPPDPLLSSECPLFVVDGVVLAQLSCAAPTKKVEPTKCDRAAPILVIDGVMQSPPCSKPSPRDSTWYFHLRNPN